MNAGGPLNLTPRGGSARDLSSRSAMSVEVFAAVARLVQARSDRRPFHSLSPALPVTQTLPAQTFAKVLVCGAPQLGEPSIELGGLLLIPCLGVEATELAVRHREEP